MMVSETLSWSMSSLLLIIIWLIIYFAALLLMALAVYIASYYWTLGRHRAYLLVFRDHQKNQQARGN